MKKTITYVSTTAVFARRYGGEGRRINKATITKISLSAKT